MLKWQRKSIYACTAVLMMSGIIWLLADWITPPLELASLIEIERSKVLKIWSIRAHSLIALVTLVVIGSLITTHMQVRWARKRNRVSAVLNLALFITLTLTGYLLWYGDEGQVRSVATLAHWVMGLMLPLVLYWHSRAVSRQRH